MGPCGQLGRIPVNPRAMDQATRICVYIYILYIYITLENNSCFVFGLVFSRSFPVVIHMCNGSDYQSKLKNKNLVLLTGLKKSGFPGPSLWTAGASGGADPRAMGQRVLPEYKELFSLPIQGSSLHEVFNRLATGEMFRDVSYKKDTRGNLFLQQDYQKKTCNSVLQIFDK